MFSFSWTDLPYEQKVTLELKQKVSNLSIKEVIAKKRSVQLKENIKQLEQKLQKQSVDLDNLQKLHDNDVENICQNEKVLQKLQVTQPNRNKIKEKQRISLESKELMKKISSL